ncbi:MAG: tripartite tricarboxylate transporter substrate binding protein [Proteobacteria bacterium]|nr:tripartite tricarboxylate transporter substrate binding protein [Burkholderiales bacterium]
MRIVVAQAAGSATDALVRIFGPRLSYLLGQPVVVDNRPGAGGSLGTEIVAKSPPDGYTTLLANTSTHGVNPALFRKLPYDPVRDFAPISLVSTTPSVVVVHPSLPVRSIKELIALARARPGQLNYSSAGSGSSQHLAAALLNTLTGIDTVHVPYRGSPAGITGLLAGEVAFMIPTLTTAQPQIQGGRLRAIAVTGRARAEELPTTPTVAETVPGFDFGTWYGVVAPAGTPQAVIARLNADLAKALALREVGKALTASGMTVATSTPEQFAAYIRTEIDKYAKVARAANIQLE